ncbi:UNVERIFIED_CONTAM: hypothetical protein GTU68_010070 [Idotea baltica]|nr:hypothetical protein [Idotea baltica]
MPKMGESIVEATVISWQKKVGDLIDIEEIVVEVATDKVDSEIPSPIGGTLVEILVQENEVVAIGAPMARIETGSEGNQALVVESVKEVEQESASIEQSVSESTIPSAKSAETDEKSQTLKSGPKSSQLSSDGDEIIEMDRMRKVIASHMKHSQEISATVTSFVEADATHLVHWRNKHKTAYKDKYGESLTFTPLFVEAVIAAIGDHPAINAMIDGDNIILKKDINIGIATAMENGNLIVPVIKNAGALNLQGLTSKMNELTSRARVNKIKADEIQGGTFTISNIGTYGNIMGTPIINQPQLAILALGAIKKKPVIQETSHGDIIAIRHMMFLSLSFDHRVIDGYQGGIFLNRIAQNIEAFNPDRSI